ncbi:hypothetical protein KEJ50_06230 [Candidatus Bathyarchaeota archaeon]|nr:hypothetical protein [Candidatus Bathyarchaeota archaeon]
MQNEFPKFIQRETLSILNETLINFPSLNLIDVISFCGQFPSSLHSGKLVIGVISCNLNECDESWLIKLKNFLDLIILVNGSSRFNFMLKKASLKNLFQEIFNSSYFSFEDFKSILALGKVAVASFGKSKSTFKIDESVRNALREISNVHLNSAKAAIIHMQSSFPLSNLEVSRAIEVLHDALNNQNAHVYCSFKLKKSKSNSLKAFLILTGFNSFEELKNRNNVFSLQLFNMEPESTSKEEKLDLNLDLPSID